jgi:hypothetical protein
MTIGIADKRPPFVMFEEREMGINPEATERAGRPIPRVVTLACITPHGSKDRFEKEATVWLKEQREKAMRGDYPLEWVNYFEAHYEAWKKGNELPREGSPTRTWSAVTKEQGLRLCALGYTTIEDVAQIPDTGLGELGPDGRYLRDLAKSWLTESKDKGINARAIADANAKIEQQSQRIESLTQQVQVLTAQLGEPKKAVPRKKGLMDEEA